MFSIAIKIEKSLHSWFSREVSKLWSQKKTLTLDWYDRGEQSRSHEHAIQSRQHAYTVLFSPVALFSCEKHYTPSISSRIHILANIIKQETSTEQWASVFTASFWRFEGSRSQLPCHYVRQSRNTFSTKSCLRCFVRLSCRTCSSLTPIQAMNVCVAAPSQAEAPFPAPSLRAGRRLPPRKASSSWRYRQRPEPDISDGTASSKLSLYCQPVRPYNSSVPFFLPSLVLAAPEKWRKSVFIILHSFKLLEQMCISSDHRSHHYLHKSSFLVASHPLNLWRPAYLYVSGMLVWWLQVKETDRTKKD